MNISKENSIINFKKDLQIRGYYNFENFYSQNTQNEISVDNVFDQIYQKLKNSCRLIVGNNSIECIEVEYHPKFGWTLIGIHHSCEVRAYLGKLSFTALTGLAIGHMSYISGDGSIVGIGTVEIGKYTSIASGITLITSNINHPTNFLSTYNFYSNERLASIKKTLPLKSYATEITKLKKKTGIKIGSDVWIGRDVTVLNGVSIGDGAVVAAKSWVNRNIEPFAIYGGTPVKFIRYRFEPKIIKKIMKLKWWDWEYEKIVKNYKIFDKNIRDTEFDF